MSEQPPRIARLALLFALLLTAGVFWLRWPTLDFRVWNVDEAIHSAVARILNDGGVLYRDAIDQRTPLTYYLVAALYRVFGEGNIWALHVLTTLIIAGTALLLFRLGRLSGRPGAGAWAAVLYAVLSTGMMWHGDAFAFNTEWCIALFTTAAAVVFLCEGARARPAAIFGIGALIGLAFLSKQPALLDLAAPGLALAYTAWIRADGCGPLLRRWVWLVAGFLAPVLLSAVYFAMKGALSDYVFYAWTYNLAYYGPEISLSDRLGIFWHPFVLLGRTYPLAGLAVVGGLAYFLYRLAQRAPTPAERTQNPFLAYLIVWTLTSLTAASSGGRTFEHYSIQVLPQLCLAGAWVLDALSRQLVRGTVMTRLAAGLALVVMVAWTAIETLGSRKRTQSVDPSKRAAEFIRNHTSPDETMFVWGYQPDAYLFADRRAASRYIYSSFVTGLIPWTNTDPTVDTAYAIVPGSMETLLADLTANRPAFLIDASEGPNRFWAKYPLVKFPDLHDFVAKNYLLAEPDRFFHQGFGVYLIRDEFRGSPVPLDGGDTPGGLLPPFLMGPASTDAKPTAFTLRGRSQTGRLQRLELLHNGELLTSVSFVPSRWMTVRIPVPFNHLGPGRHVLTARATDAQGNTLLGDDLVVTVDAMSMQPEQMAAFALPHLSRSVPPVSIRAAFGANVEEDEGRLVFYAHAPSTLTYHLEPGARMIRGMFAIRPQAYAENNPHPSDGAEFQVNLLRPDGSRDILFNKLIRPGHVPAERGLQPLSIEVPEGAVGQIEFITLPGPSGNPSSDWTYWSDLVVETGR